VNTKETMPFSVKAHHLPQRVATGAFTQTTQAQSTEGQGTEAQGTEDQSRGEQAWPYLENASYPVRREDLAVSAEQHGADQDVVDLIVVIPDDEYADVDTVIVQIDLVDANA
jgi:Protein of unknown function (DUF2795)